MLRFGFGSVWACVGIALFLFGLASARLRFYSGTFWHGFVSVRARIGLATVPFGFASARLRILSGSLRHGFVSVRARFDSGSVPFGFVSVRLRFLSRCMVSWITVIACSARRVPGNILLNTFPPTSSTVFGETYFEFVDARPAGRRH